MKIQCDCGYLISDTTDFLPYKASLIADQDNDDLMTAIDRVLADLAQSASKLGNHEKAIAAASHDVSQAISIKYGRRTVYQCLGCRSLFVDDITGRPFRFTPANPDVPPNLLRSAEGDRWHGSLLGEWSDARTADPKGALYWWKVENEDGYAAFHDWESLERTYFTTLKRLTSKRILRSAMLKKNGQVIHSSSASVDAMI